jgi:DNA modification methylase
MVSPGHRGLPALLGNQPVCAGADPENRAGGLRGGDRVEPGLVIVTTSAFGRVTTLMLTLLQGDALEQLASLPDGSVQCCVTSPPYWGLRDYGTAAWEGGEEECDHLENVEAAFARRDGGRANIGIFNGSSKTNLAARPYKEVCGHCGARRIDAQLGLEATPEEYIANIVKVFREVKRVLRDVGTLWLNMGDSYASSGTSGTQNLAAFSAKLGRGNCKENPDRRNGRAPTPEGLKPKDLCMMPARVALALQADGWYLRSDIIWHKPNPMPESVTDRPTKSHEYIFLLTKQERYFYDAEAIREPKESDHEAISYRGGAYCNNSTFDNANGGNRTVKGDRKLKPLEGSHGTLGMDGNGMRMPEKWDNPNGRNKRSVWTIATQPYAEAHFATFPEEIPKLCILAGSKVGDLVLDPFAGSGTVGQVALELGRRAILIELNPQYCELARKRCAVTIGMF